MAITIKDIARECGVSVTSVSFVLNGKESSVSKKTAERIKEVCKKHDFKQNYIAAALKNKSTKTIGVLIPDIENGYYTRIIKRLEILFRKEGYGLISVDSGYDYQNFKSNLFYMIDKSVDFLIIIPASSFQEEQERINKEIVKNIRIPYCIVDRKIDFGEGTFVLNDDIEGGYIATKHLIENGHKTIACITGPKNLSSSIDRLEGYKKALSENNIPFDENLVFESNYRFQGTELVAKKILENKDVTAIFAFNDLMAYSVYKACDELNLKVGEDISLIGYDDNQFSELITPGLTTIKQDIDELCNIVCDVFLKEDTLKQYVVEPSLKIRGSIKNVKS